MENKYIIRIKDIENLDNIDYDQEILNAIGKKKYKDKFWGVIKITTSINSDGFITKKLEPIEGTSANYYRELMKLEGVKIPIF